MSAVTSSPWRGALRDAGRPSSVSARWRDRDRGGDSEGRSGALASRDCATGSAPARRPEGARQGSARPIPVRRRRPDRSQGCLVDLSSASARSAPLPGTTPRCSSSAHVSLVAAPAAVLIAGAAWWGIAHQSRATAAIAPVFRQVTAVGNLIDGALSPDGRSSAFITDTQGDRRLLTRDLAGGPSIELAHGGDSIVRNGLAMAADPLPHRRRRISHSRLRRHAAALLLRESVGMVARRIARGGSTSTSTPVFGFLSPDGTRLAPSVTVAHARWLFGVDWQSVRSAALVRIGRGKSGGALDRPV